ncbi:hypothetical protein LTR10_009679 [Elasticomyces elasticus]|nr:hypothetical protein LTR10_009679 [Elasticomyces elasticus]KAK4969970.1 hypothetical protein LTR42_008137 [Elasticomyces elasticus]
MAPQDGATSTGALGITVNNTALMGFDISRLRTSTTELPSRPPVSIRVFNASEKDEDYQGFDTVLMDYQYDLDHTQDGVIYVGLSHAGCLVDERQNCTAACADPKSVWGVGNLSTLANCMLYPVIASALGQGVNVTWVPPGPPSDPDKPVPVWSLPWVPFPTDGSVFGIVPDSSLDLHTPIPWTVLNDCTTAYCRAISETGGNCDLTDRMVYNPNISIGAFSPALHLNTTLCSLDDSLNPDLGGVGMMIAYLIQFSVLLTAWLLNMISEVGTAVFVQVTRMFVSRRHDRDGWQRWARRIRQKVQSSWQAAALNATLVEFQKTQVFFMLAVAIAGLQAVHDARSLDSSTMLQLFNNNVFIPTVALSGSYPVVLNLLILRRTAKTSQFILVISTCCVIVSSALWLYSGLRQTSRPSRDQINASNFPKLVECGGSYPTRTCQGITDSGWQVSSYDFDLRVWLYPLVAIILLAAEEVKLFKPMAEDVKKEGKKNDRTNVFTYLQNLLRTRTRALSKSTRPMKGLSGARTSFQAIFGNVSKYKNTSQRQPTRRTTYHFWRTMRSLAAATDKTLVPHYFATTFALPRPWAQVSLDIMGMCYKYLPFLAELGFVGMSAMLLARYAWHQQRMAHAAWSLGQIISVTIWVPVGVEYVHLLFWGIEDGFEHRLKSPYHVKKDEDEEELKEVITSEDEENAVIGAAQHIIGSQSPLENDSHELEMIANFGSEVASLTSRRSWEPHVS